MKFGNYILLSVLFHLFFFGILGAAYSNGHERERVFNVDIVEIEPLKSSEIKRSKPVLKKRRPAVRRRRPMAKHLPPDTIRDEVPSSPSIQEEEADAMPEAAGGNEPAPSFLFDREIIEKYASKVPLPEKDLTFDTSEFKHRGYMRILREKIESIWEYPKDAVKSKMSGDLYIMFTIKRKGDLGEVEVLRTSGHRSLDRAAIKALKDAAPFWPLPDDWPEEQIEIKGHFIYIYGRTYVM